MRGIATLAALAILTAASNAVLADPLAGPAATPPAQAATAVSPANAKANGDDKMICKTETPIGSRLGGHRVCMKKSDWDAQAADARRQRDFAPPAGIGGPG